MCVFPSHSVGSDLIHGSLAYETCWIDILPVMRAIINGLWGLGRFDKAKLCKYMRCLFHVVLPKDDRGAFHLLEEICKVVREASKASLPPFLDNQFGCMSSCEHNLPCV